MNLKLLIKILSFFLVTSFVSASETNNCNEIKEYLEKKSLNYTKTIEKCSMNDQGKVIELIVKNENLQEEDVNKILSYDTIKDLEYVVVFNSDPEVVDSIYSSHPLIPHPGYSDFPYTVTHLPELEKLNFNYENLRYVKYYPYINYTSIEDGTFKLLKSIKNLTLSQVNITNENLREISTLVSLEELQFCICVIDNDGFMSFENLNNLLKLSIINLKGMVQVIPKYIGKIKSLKELHIEKGDCEEGSYDFNGLDNLEILYLDLKKECNFDLTKSEKLTELSILSIENVFFGISFRKPFPLKFPDSIKKLVLTDLVFSSDNFQVIASLPNLEELTMSYYHGGWERFSDEFVIKTLESRDKLRKLTINSSININKNLEFFSKLENLTYLDLSRNTLTDIYLLENLKNLEYIGLSDNGLNEFPKELITMKNLEYINLSRNSIKDLPDEIGKLENLKILDLSYNAFTKFPMAIANLKNLENLHLELNEIEDEIPESYNNLSELKAV